MKQSWVEKKNTLPFEEDDATVAAVTVQWASFSNAMYGAYTHCLPISKRISYVKAAKSFFPLPPALENYWHLYCKNTVKRCSKN